MGWDKNSTSTLAGRVRAQARKLGEGEKEFSAEDLSHAVGIQTFDENRKLHWTIRDLKRSGEIVLVARGKYRLGDREPERANQAAQKRVVMWRFLRMRRLVSAGDLQEAAGVNATYAQEWLRMLKRQGVVSAVKAGKYQLLVDSPEVPSDTEKAEKLRQLRARRKANLIAIIDDAQMRLQEASQRLDEARGELVSMGEE